MSCYQKGWIAATMIGSPCETFSEAQYQQEPDSEKRWPRLLRSATQTTANGFNFFLQGALVACFQLIHGMYFI